MKRRNPWETFFESLALMAFGLTSWTLVFLMLMFPWMFK